MTLTGKDILNELEALGRESYKMMLVNDYGVKEPCFGVRIDDTNPIQKRIETNYRLALDLYDTGNLGNNQCQDCLRPRHRPQTESGGEPGTQIRRSRSGIGGDDVFAGGQRHAASAPAASVFGQRADLVRFRAAA